MLSKPGSRAEALMQLRRLSGRTHWLHSGAVVAERGERVWGDTESVEGSHFAILGLPLLPLLAYLRERGLLAG
jgi:predicted house-cleaning NTP pyrophosphatase (Maf/HAM1 superfamily)